MTARASTALAAVALLFRLSAPGPASSTEPEPCITSLADVEPIAQEGPACLPTAAAMALAALGQPLDPQDIARRLPMFDDGSGFFDLQNELTRRRLETLVFTGMAADAGRAIRAGIPVIAAVHRGGGKHAVLVVGISRAVAADGSCGHDLEALRILDPAAGVAESWDAARFDTSLFAGQQMLVLPSSDDALERLEAANFPLARARAENRRFRAQGWLRLADEHDQPNAQVLELVTRAVCEDPTWKDTRARLADLHDTLGQEQAAEALRGGDEPPACAAER